MPGSNIKSAPVQLPKVYKTQDFNEEVYRNNRLATMYGTEASRRDKRKFKRYMQSEDGLAAMDQARQAHIQNENAKALQSYKDYTAAAKNQFSNQLTSLRAQFDAALQKYDKIGQVEAKKDGFKSMGDVKQRQAANGLVADGKFGKKSLEMWNAQQNPTPASTSGTPIAESRGISSDLSNTPIPEPSVTPAETKRFNLRQFAQHNGLDIVNKNGQEVVRWDPSGFGDFWVDSNGEIYEGGRTFDNTRKFRNAAGLGYGERKNRYEALQAAISGQSETGDYGVKIIEKRPTSTTVYPRPVYTHAPYRTLYRKQGGTMNRINYFQQGGVAPKQDIKAQITALVQAAMQGDQKATQQVNQIMEAAKAGNQQAVQLAQLITEVAKQLQGQATSAKWGSKLDYIKSLKFAKGGKTCPVCDKKVEMKACGGKKAKKRYFGGII